MLVNKYLDDAIELTLNQARARKADEQAELEFQNKLKRDSMLEKVANLGAKMLSGKASFAEQQTFEDICQQYEFNPADIINGSYKDASRQFEGLNE